MHSDIIIWLISFSNALYIFLEKFNKFQIIKLPLKSPVTNKFLLIVPHFITSSCPDRVLNNNLARDIKILVQLAISYEKLKRYGDAIGIYDKILFIDPANKIAKYKKELIVGG